MDDQYTWGTFKSAVLDLLTVDKDRDGTTAFRDAQLRQAVIHLQSLIPQFRLGHEAIYHAQDVVGEGYASRGTKPPMSAIRDVWLVKLNSDDQTCYRYPLRIIPWENRFAMINGNASVANQAAFSIDPQGYTFYVTPQIEGRWLLSLFWDGQKLEFQDDEAVPFPERMVGAVADYVKAKLLREVEKDIQLHDSYMITFQRAIPMLTIEAKDRARVMNTGGEGGGVKCGGRTVCELSCNPSSRCPNQIMVGNGSPITEDTPPKLLVVPEDRSISYLYKDTDTGALWVWNVSSQTWI